MDITSSSMWLQSEGVIIMGVIFLALMMAYHKTQEIRKEKLTVAYKSKTKPKPKK